MSVPVLRQGDCIIVPIQEALTDKQMFELRTTLVETTGKVRARAVVIDVSGLDVIDSYTARTLQDMTRMVKLKGARAVVAGIQPAVAFSMVQLGLRLDGVATVLDLDEALFTLRAPEAQEAADGAEDVRGRP